ncbi:hypothetical protein O3P69_007061 [Scylla paramamosain]|uniref:Uncharacterized protein n=1 Tax=Scylla paramamosain TaxID=85552 RepID=A0AAW0V2K1_SCYPA
METDEGKQAGQLPAVTSITAPSNKEAVSKCVFVCVCVCRIPGEESTVNCPLSSSGAVAARSSHTEDKGKRGVTLRRLKQVCANAGQVVGYGDSQVDRQVLGSRCSGRRNTWNLRPIGSGNSSSLVHELNHIPCCLASSDPVKFSPRPTPRPGAA